MRCEKCGYVSFDHLSECKNCHASMTAAREGFRFSTAKPSVPSLLGSLLNETPPTAKAPSPAADTETYHSFELQGEIPGALGEEFTIESGSEEDFSLLDISDEELELLIEQDSLESNDKSTGPMETGGSKQPGKPVSSPPAGSASSEIGMVQGVDASSDGDLELSLDDFFEMENETKADHQPGLTANSHGGPATPPAEAAQSNDSMDDFVIDLSESDLDDLLKRLEESAGKKA
ncbi:MAG: hypothetical protein P4L55_22650 [Syntrophobacteraceae bacterium]|nr:hypothetical protein [Syntrophobacteraceae bacterium]